MTLFASLAEPSRREILNILFEGDDDMSNTSRQLPASSPEAEGVIGKITEGLVTTTFTRSYPHNVEHVCRTAVVARQRIGDNQGIAVNL